MKNGVTTFTPRADQDNLQMHALVGHGYTKKERYVGVENIY